MAKTNQKLTLPSKSNLFSRHDLNHSTFLSRKESASKWRRKSLITTTTMAPLKSKTQKLLMLKSRTISQVCNLWTTQTNVLQTERPKRKTTRKIKKTLICRPWLAHFSAYLKPSNRWILKCMLSKRQVASMFRREVFRLNAIQRSVKPIPRIRFGSWNLRRLQQKDSKAIFMSVSSGR